MALPLYLAVIFNWLIFLFMEFNSLFKCLYSVVQPLVMLRGNAVKIWNNNILGHLDALQFKSDFLISEIGINLNKSVIQFQFQAKLNG